MIDKIGGIGPSIGHKKTEPVKKKESIKPASERVSISDEATRAAETVRLTKTALQSEDTARIEKLAQVKEKLARGDYNHLSDEILQTLSDKLIDSFGIFGPTR